jgi:hypothetical protein
MFKWYSQAQVCYAYLSDVPSAMHDHEDPNSAFKECIWFKRGWMLQELLAPQDVEFLDVTWTEIGTKSSLEALIGNITGIRHLSNFYEASVTQKMSWTAKRQATRDEDQAYCLMGLFDVNMGEGREPSSDSRWRS